MGIDAGDGVAEGHGNVSREADGKAQYSLLPAGTGNSPASSAVIAASQSMLASSAPGAVILEPTWMKRSKSSRAGQDPWAMINPVPASITHRPSAPARSAAWSDDAVTSLLRCLRDPGPLCIDQPGGCSGLDKLSAACPRRSADHLSRPAFRTSQRRRSAGSGYAACWYRYVTWQDLAGY